MSATTLSVIRIAQAASEPSKLSKNLFIPYDVQRPGIPRNCAIAVSSPENEQHTPTQSKKPIKKPVKVSGAAGKSET
jgi:hypothetical protein